MNTENISPRNKIVYAPIIFSDKPVAVWLLIGCAMIYVMVILGGITRLTGSGLSIVEWNVIMGTFPPMNEQQWNESFEKYKQFPQYEKLNRGMTIPQFKKIFWWEYIHRLWGRLIGVAFIIPFIYFLYNKQIDKTLFVQLLIAFLLGAMQGIVGWLIVKSGLVDTPWVSPYRLTLHLFLALFLYGYVFWIALKMILPPDMPQIKEIASNRLQIFSYWITGLLVVQIFFGGLMSGMKAGLFCPTFPTMNGEIFPTVMMIRENWQWKNFLNYDKHIFAPIFIQFIHRNLGYFAGLLIIFFWIWVRNNYQTSMLRTTARLFLVLLIVQIFVGVITILKCYGHVPILWGVLHQAGALALLTTAIFTNYILKQGAIPKSAGKLEETLVTEQ